MALALKKKPDAAKSSGPKLAKAGKAAKPAAKGKAPAGPSFKEGQVVQFKGYASAPENPIFEEGDRLVLIKKDKDEDGKVMFDAVKEADHEAYLADNDSVDGDQVHASEIEKAEKVEVDPYAIEVVPVGRLEDVLSENGDDPLVAAQQMQDEAAENLFLFGGLAAMLYANRKFVEYGDQYEDDEVDGKRKHTTGWDRFCREHFNMGYRDVNRHIRIYQNMAGIEGLDWASISKNKKIGYVKLEKIAGVATKENVAELLERAEELNVEDFKAVIRDEYVSDGESRAGSSGPKLKRTSFGFKLFEDQAEGVKYVLEQAKKTLALEDDAQVLEAIIMGWAQSNLTETAFAKARTEKRKVQKALAKSGVDISKLKENDARLEDILTEGDDADGEDEGNGGDENEG